MAVTPPCFAGRQLFPSVATRDASIHEAAKEARSSKHTGPSNNLKRFWHHVGLAAPRRPPQEAASERTRKLREPPGAACAVALPRLGAFGAAYPLPAAGKRREATGEKPQESRASGKRLPRSCGRRRLSGRRTPPSGEAAGPAGPPHLLHRSLSASRRRTHQVLGVLVHVGHAAPVLLVKEQHVPHP